jgi:hypothetical protein
VLLAGRGLEMDHPSTAANIATLVQVVTERPGQRILNAADPDAPNGLAISPAIAGLARHQWREVLLDDDTPGDLVRHPWHTLPPFVLDMRAAAALGYQPLGDYATTIIEEARWLIDQYRTNPDTQLSAGLDKEFFTGRALSTWLPAS